MPALGWELAFLPVSSHQPFGFLKARGRYHGSFRKQPEIASEDPVESASILPDDRGDRNPFEPKEPNRDDFVWMPEYPNRTTAINTARRIFNHILTEAELVDEDRKLSPYSLRHYAIQARLRGSKG